MLKWFKNLDYTQKKILLLLVIIIIALPAAGSYIQNDDKKPDLSLFTVNDSISKIAPQMGVTKKSLARELGLKLSVNKNIPLSELNIKPDDLNHALEHIASHSGNTLKYYIFVSIFLGAHFYLLLLGRPKKSKAQADKAVTEEPETKAVKTWYPKGIHILFLLFSLFLCGIWLGKSPNPMEGCVKVFKSMAGLYPDPLVKSLLFFFFLALAWIGNKIICGWACPFGSLQELIFYLPVFKKIKNNKIPFIITNTVRSLLFIVMLFLLFGIFTDTEGLVIYHYLNPFNLFNLDFESPVILYSVIFFILASFFTYRPFCRFICPFGLMGWLLEKTSIYSVKIDHSKCINCGACCRACPLDAAKARIDDKIMSSECYSCARCLNVCPVDAVRYCRKIKESDSHEQKS